MALRSIIDIDVDDAKFDAFLAKWKQYQDESTKASRVSRITVEFDKKDADTKKAASRELERHVSYTEKLQHAWAAMRDTTGSVVRNVREIATRVLHTTTLMAGIGGLATGFGFLGMDLIGRSASSWRRASLGGGTSIGGMRAFGLDFNRFIDPSAFMGGVGQAMRDPTRSVALRALGIMPGAGEDTADVAAKALERVQNLAKSTPEAMLGTLLQSHRLGDLGLSIEDLTRLRGMSSQEMRDQQRAFRGDRGRLNLTDAQAKGWQDFVTTLERARASIETTFIVHLSPLAPALGKLSTAITHVIESFLGKKDLTKWIDDFAGGIEKFAKYVGSDSFEKDVVSFTTGVTKMAKSIVGFLKFVTGNSPPASADNPVPTPPGSAPPAIGGWGWGRRRDGTWGWGHTPGANENNPGAGGPLPLSPINYRVPTDDAAMADRERTAHDFFRRAGWGENQTAGLMAYMRGESGFNPQAFNPAGGGQGAQGVGQWRGDRIARFRQMFGHDPRQGTLLEQLQFMHWELTHTEAGTGRALMGVKSAAEAAAEVLRSYGRPGAAAEAKRLPGDMGRAEQYRRQFGPGGNAPAPTRVLVTVRNEIGGNAIVSTGQVAV